MERAVVFRVEDDELVGILHPGEVYAPTGVLVIVGGPQYRVGSHRQFVLLARFLADHGIPVFRFDYRGMGDADGEQRDFEQIDEDVHTAIDVFMAATPGMRDVVIWGLCDAASAALCYAHQDRKVSGLILLNPWVRTEEGIARAYLKHYYLQRLVSKEFWGGLLRGRFNPVTSARSLLGMVSRVATGGQGDSASTGGANSARRLPERMAAGWKRFDGPIMLILSGNDLTADEFRDVTVSSPAWKGLLDRPRVTVRELPGANHTFSRLEWREQVARWTLEGLSRFA